MRATRRTITIRRTVKAAPKANRTVNAPAVYDERSQAIKAMYANPTMKIAFFR